MILKCKMCGGDIQAMSDMAYGTCDSCGVMSTLPKASDEKLINLFNRANHFRRLNEFDRALTAYENILNEDNTNAEAHWGLVLCRYGIEYVEDPQTQERIPTCHRVQYESVLSDPDYLAALDFSFDEQARSIYENEAKRISEIQQAILAISKNEEAYDVFICYKETTSGGSRTKDSTIAQDIYYQLTNDGYRVFFSKISLEDKLGQQYEPYIFAALNSAKVMLVVSTSKEHFEAVWVKNEWSRFLAIMKRDRSRLLIPCYRDMDAYDMPDELSNFQSQDMSKVGFMQDLIRGIRKVLDVSTTNINQGSPYETVRHASTAGTDSLLRRAYMFIEDGYFDKATEYFDKVLDNDPENASAYWGLIMSKYNCRTEEQLSNCLIEYDGDYKKAMRFANAEQKAKYQSFAEIFRSSVSQKLNNSSSIPGAAIINGGFSLWDFIKYTNSAEYFRMMGGDNLATEWLFDSIPFDTNPIVSCSNAKVVIVNRGSITLEDIMPAIIKVYDSKSIFLIVICAPCDQELLNTLLLNSNRGTFKSLVFSLNGDVAERDHSIQNISRVTGAKVFSTPNAAKSITDDDFGVVSEFYACGESAMFVASHERLQQLNEQKRFIEEQRLQEEQHKREQDALVQKMQEERRLEEEHRLEQLSQWVSQGLCRYCGGSFGLFKKCKSCGKAY